MNVDLSFKVPLDDIEPKMVRSIRDLALVLMEVVNRIQGYLKVTPEGNVRICSDDNMKRIFFYEEDRMYSMMFPFSLQRKTDEACAEGGYFQEEYCFVWNTNEINSAIISAVISLLKNDKLTEYAKLSYENFLFEIDACLNEYDCVYDLDVVWGIYYQLLSNEYGYVRFDHDEKHNGPNHPLNHLDVNMSNDCTYKIGLPNDPRPSENWFTEMCLSNPVKCINVL